MTQVDSQTWGRVCELFDELVELPPSGRDERLAELAREAPAIAHQVRAMLRADDSSAGILEASLDELAPELSEAGPAWETLAGSQFGPYRLIEPMGEGGMGEVWRAERADGVYQQDVALKLLKRGMDTQAILRRFMQERAILARLEHPNIVHLLDGGMSEDGRPWYAMACVDGLPLIEHAAHARLDVRARIELLATVADAVAYAHARLVVHRDLKPGNILVDAGGEPRLLDFGIAKLLEDTSDGTVTGTGMRVLSPAYAAPEQILGMPVSTATDVYALGLVAYQLLTGRLPHQRQSRDPGVLAISIEQEADAERASHAIAHGEASALRDIYGKPIERRRLARQVAGDLDLILATALRVEPERRYAGAAAFAADLRAWLEARPIAARPDSTGYRLRRFVRRHVLGVTAGIVVTASLLTGMGLALWQANIARLQAERAEEQARHAERQARRAQAINDFIVTAFSGLNPTLARDGVNLSLHEFLLNTLGRLDDALAQDPDARNDLRVTLAVALDGLGDTPAARKALEQAEHELLALPEAAPKTLGVLMHQMAMLNQRAGDMDAADAYLVRAIEALEKGDAASNAQTRISVRTTIASLAVDRGRYREQLEQQIAIHADRLALNGVEDARMAVDWMNRCLARWYLADYEQAERDCRHAQILLDSDPQSPRARTAWIGNALGLVLAARGRLEEAERVYLDALNIIVQTLGPEHPMHATLTGNLAAALLERGDFEAALAQIEIGLAHPSLTPDHPRAYPLRSLQGAAFAQLGRFEEAERSFNAISTSYLDNVTLQTLRTRRRHAELQLLQGRPDEAAAALVSILEGYRHLELHHHDDHARTLLLQADLMQASGNIEAARVQREQAFALLRAVLDPGHPLLRQ